MQAADAKAKIPNGQGRDALFGFCLIMLSIAGQRMRRWPWLWHSELDSTILAKQLSTKTEGAEGLELACMSGPFKPVVRLGNQMNRMRVRSFPHAIAGFRSNGDPGRSGAIL